MLCRAWIIFELKQGAGRRGRRRREKKRETEKIEKEKHGKGKMYHGPKAKFVFLKTWNNTSSGYIMGTKAPKQMGNWRSRPIQISIF
ncbi:MAG: hypothetical protein KF829_06475 [Ferruginibacter sp.]|nr:hypothetical protein [Ferruginibacter sp.]